MCGHAFYLSGHLFGRTTKLEAQYLLKAHLCTVASQFITVQVQGLEWPSCSIAPAFPGHGSGLHAGALTLLPADSISPWLGVANARAEPCLGSIPAAAMALYASTGTAARCARGLCILCQVLSSPPGEWWGCRAPNRTAQSKISSCQRFFIGVHQGHWREPLQANSCSLAYLGGDDNNSVILGCAVTKAERGDGWGQGQLQMQANHCISC